MTIHVIEIIIRLRNHDNVIMKGGNEMNKLFNGNEVNEINVMEMLKENESNPSDMTQDEVKLIKKVASQNYEGADEDLSYLIEELQTKNSIGYLYPDANWQTVYDILSKGSWYYQKLSAKEYIENEVEERGLSYNEDILIDFAEYEEVEVINAAAELGATAFKAEGQGMWWICFEEK